MCKLKGYGKRCPATPQRKEAESYRQKVKYQAKKEGLSSQEWLSTERGSVFAQNNDPRILNPNWHKEHQESLAKMHSTQPQVTMSDDFLASPADLSIIKANFPERDTVRGQERLASLDMTNYLDEVSKQAKTLTPEEAESIRIYSSSQYKKINTLLREIDPNMSPEEYREKFYPRYNDEDFEKMDSQRRKTIENLDSALSERRAESEVTYRCITTQKSIEESLEEYKPNAVLSFDGYTSTSHSPAVAVVFSDLMPEFGEFDDEDDMPTNEGMEQKTMPYEHSEYAPSNHNLMFEMQSNAGQPIAMHSELEAEKEILIPRGMHFKVVNSYVATEESPYRIDQGKSGFYEGGDVIGEVKSHLVVVQLVECDKDGNIVSPNAKDPYNPPPLASIQSGK